jgi:hypothetical protein
MTKLPGPKPRQGDPSEELARTLVRDRNPGTLARCSRASTLLVALSSVVRWMVDGAVNVSNLLRLVEDAAVRYRITTVQGSHRTIVQTLLANSDSRARIFVCRLEKYSLLASKRMTFEMELRNRKRQGGSIHGKALLRRGYKELAIQLSGLTVRQQLELGSSLDGMLAAW